MRSRFAAFAIGDAAHLLRTWHPETRPDAAELAADLASPEAPQWRRLLIRDVVGGADADDRGVVEFIGIGRGSGGRVELHERSQFVRDGGAWLYTTGEILD
ncbi:YchJ family protein [Helcobacillus massiliensis]|uniref:YchJ family protein n=2 Tax=Dermabacteraceae TaxID=85020 RepID=UPI00295419EE|nr:YchJ family metal-binding protein [Helcobacillus massiliensis]WOO93551.1 YchJ family metal-binding protein [Helcobacillus massiliensis]